MLSQAARFADPIMLQIKNLGYDSWQTVYFQRATVILSELVLLYALYLFVQTSPVTSRKQSHAAAVSIFLSPGLLIIDHIHFQYNGFLYGILILSVVLARKESGLLASGVLFAALLCLKHIYLYLAPAYFVFLLRTYCLGRRSIYDLQFFNCLKLGVGLLAIFALAFGPFVYYGQIPQVLSRLFPFSRGLCHAYWAPNVWAMYSFVDRVLIICNALIYSFHRKLMLIPYIVGPYLKIPIDTNAVNSVTRGLVGDTSFAVLPNITPRMTFILTLAAQIVSHCSSHFYQRPADIPYSPLFSSSSSHQPGRPSSQPSSFAATPPSSLAGTSTRKPFFSSSFHSLSSLSKTVATSAPSARWL